MRLPATIKAVLIDLSGVLYVGDRAFDGADIALRRLRAAGPGLLFLTNTMRSPHSAVLKKVADMGFSIGTEELLTAPMATKKLITQRGLEPHYLVHPDIEAELGPSAEAPTAVVLGDAGSYFTYDRLNRAFRLLMKGLPLIVMAKNRFFREGDGISLDMGAFVAALEFAAGVEDVGATANETVMIGDDLRRDPAIWQTRA